MPAPSRVLAAASPDPGSLAWYWLGRAPYRRVLADQLALRERVWAGGDGAVYLCEHPPVITLGRSATLDHVLDAGDVPIERIDRGGQVTYHGPGQLMIYPIVRIRSVVAFLERVAGAIIDACAALGVAGARWQRDPAGVWRDGAKLAACGIHVARGVPVHGFALDVDTPASAWARIRPCGLEVPQLSLALALAGGSTALASSGSGALARPLRVDTVACEVGPRVAAALSIV